MSLVSCFAMYVAIAEIKCPELRDERLRLPLAECNVTEDMIEKAKVELIERSQPRAKLRLVRTTKPEVRIE